MVWCSTVNCDSIVFWSRCGVIVVLWCARGGVNDGGGEGVVLVACTVVLWYCSVMESEDTDGRKFC